MVVLLVVTVVCVAAALGFYVAMMRRDEPHLGMVGMMVLQVGGRCGTMSERWRLVACRPVPRSVPGAGRCR